VGIVHLHDAGVRGRGIKVFGLNVEFFFRSWAGKS
jgi:hypothetical protein